MAWVTRQLIAGMSPGASFRISISCSPVSELSTNGRKAASGYPVRATRPGHDQPSQPQPPEEGQAEVGKDHSVMGEACDGYDFRAIRPLVQNAATKGQNVQGTLFLSGYVHGSLV